MRDGHNPIFFTELADSADYTANENYGATQRLIIAPAEGAQYFIDKLYWTIADNDSDYNMYGNMAALSTGIRLVLEDTDGNEIVDLLAGSSIKKTEDFFEIGFSITSLNSVANDIRLTQAVKAFDSKLVVRYGERLAWILPAVNFSGLEKHSMLADVIKKAAR